MASSSLVRGCGSRPWETLKLGPWLPAFDSAASRLYLSALNKKHCWNFRLGLGLALVLPQRALDFPIFDPGIRRPVVNRDASVGCPDQILMEDLPSLSTAR